MGMRSAIRVAVALVVAVVTTADAAVICQKKSGAMFVRDACKKKETRVDLATFGAVGPPGPPGMPTAISFAAPASTPATTIFDSGKLSLIASCSGMGLVTLVAKTAVDNASIRSYGNSFDAVTNDFDVATPLTIGDDVTEHRSLVYTEPGGQVVTVQYQISDSNPASMSTPLGGTVACLVSGIAFQSP